jgi:hypothetical protein
MDGCTELHYFRGEMEVLGETCILLQAKLLYTIILIQFLEGSKYKVKTLFDSEISKCKES